MLKYMKLLLEYIVFELALVRILVFVIHGNEYSF